jgi:hypothetical protein
MKLLLLILLFVTTAATAQPYTDPFPDERAPYRFRIYEAEVLAAKQIARVDTYWVVKKYNRVWMQGIYPYTGDTTNLKYIGREMEPLNFFDSTIWLVSPAYKRYDTIYVLPTLQGFETWKQERGYK